MHKAGPPPAGTQRVPSPEGEDSKWAQKWMLPASEQVNGEVAAEGLRPDRRSSVGMLADMLSPRQRTSNANV